MTGSVFRDGEETRSAEQPGLRLRLIGHMGAWTAGGAPVLPVGRKTRALLACIVLTAPRAMTRNRLAELLWSRRPEEQARASLRQEIHRLLDALAPVGADVLTVSRDQIALQPGVVTTDIDAIMQADTAQPGAPPLPDGDLLEDLDGTDPQFDIWLKTRRQRLQDRARQIAEAQLRDDMEPDAAIAAAQRLLSIDRTHEGAWRTLMRAHAARGERGLAIQAYDRCRAVLADLIDTAPSAETERLLREIRGLAKPRPAEPMAVLPVAPAAARPDPAGAAPAEPATTAPADPPRRAGVRIGVMPLRVVGLAWQPDADLAPGLTDEISNGLSRFRGMSVISSGALSRYGAAPLDEMAVREAFDLDYLIDGSVQRAGGRVRVSLRLLDLRASNQIVWASRFDRDAGDLLALQDDIAAEVVAQLDPEIMLIEARRHDASGAGGASAYELMLRALPLMNRLERGAFMLAGRFLADAITLEPDYPPAHAWYAYWHIFLVGQNWAENPTVMMQRAEALAERAIILDPGDARGLTISGHVRAFLHHRLAEAIALHERALSLNPNLTMAWALSAIAHTYIGNLAEAERRYQHYKRLSPLDPYAFFYDAAGVLIHLLKHEHEAACAAGRATSQLNPGFSAILRHYLSALGHLGHQAEAETVRRRLLALEPEFTIVRFLASTALEREADRMHVADGLRRAGIEEYVAAVEAAVPMAQPIPLRPRGR